MSVALDLADIAAEQWGLLTSAQARAAGVSAQSLARYANQGLLERLSHGVYRTSGAPPTPLDGLRAAWLTLDPARRRVDRVREQSPAVVSHRSAALVHRLGDLEADEFEFTTPIRKQTRRPSVRLHRAQLQADDWTVVDGLPVTTVTRTIDDLASDRIDGGHLAGVVRDAMTRHMVDDQKLVAVLRRYAHLYGAPLGDGSALLRRLMQESGVAETLAAVVRFATLNPSPPMDALK
ncbi:type IV toxin-antitoxin system AbiEi family antitoxin domain-containing protein [Tessaracoccus sp. G1721]